MGSLGYAFVCMVSDLGLGAQAGKNSSYSQLMSGSGGRSKFSYRPTSNTIAPVVGLRLY